MQIKINTRFYYLVSSLFLSKMDESTAESAKIKIRHLVLSGGATILFQYYSVLKQSMLAGFWNRSEIKSTYSTSAGSLALLLVLLGDAVGWESSDNFLINRPWHTVYNFSADRLLKAYGNVGIFDRTVMEDMFAPLLSALDLPLNITLKEFYEFIGIEMHFMATRLSTYEPVDVSYKTHPDWKLIDIITATCALPVLFSPIEIDGELYADGALLCNYPIKTCLDAGGNAEEILGLYKTTPTSPSDKIESERCEYTNIFAYLVDILTKSVGHTQKVIHIPHEIVCTGEHSMALTQVYDICKSPDIRKSELKAGEDVWNEFYAKLCGI